MTPMPALDLGRIRLRGVFVYLERTLAPATPLAPGSVPRSYGLAPTVVDPAGGDRAGAAVAAVGADEAVWLGFQAIDEAHPATLRIRVGVDQPLDAISGASWIEDASARLTCPPAYALPGLTRPEGVLPFRAGDTLTVLVDDTVVDEAVVDEAVVDDGPVEVVVRLVSPEEFTRLTGTRPAPLDPRDAYQGRRLP